jgi:hypothetical protein
MPVMQMIIFWDSNGRNMKGILCIAKVFRFSGPLQKTNLLTAVAKLKSQLQIQHQVRLQEEK